VRRNFNTAQSRIHKSDIRTLAPKLRHGPGCVRSLCDESHIRLRSKSDTGTLTKNLMIFRARDANGLRKRSHRKRPFVVILCHYDVPGVNLYSTPVVDKRERFREAIDLPTECASPSVSAISLP
jgi:hypothetical protein